jgi:bifunctional DNA-binding transcriptional regulator/antitoxin component of YhaV-PrlF toxin-antitoxin module
MTQLIPIRNGSITIPDELRERYGIEDGSLIVIEGGLHARADRRVPAEQCRQRRGLSARD